MSKDILQNKIALLEEQIENLERSGFFTEKEIDKYSVFYRNELELLKSALAVTVFCESIENAATKFKETSNAFNFLKEAKALSINVHEPNILTQNNRRSSL